MEDNTVTTPSVSLAHLQEEKASYESGVRRLCAQIKELSQKLETAQVNLIATRASVSTVDRLIELISPKAD